jgi:hypothetical protein
MQVIMQFAVEHIEVVALEVGMVAFYLSSRFVRPMGRLVDRSIETCKILFGDRRIPKVAKAFLALAFIPIPGPFDEIMASIAVVILMRGGHGAIVRETWRSTQHSKVVRRVMAWTEA